MLAASLFALASGCKTESGKVKLDKQQLSIDTFTGWPDFVDGCSSAYSLNKSDYDADKFIFAGNLTDSALMVINGEDVIFHKEESNTLPSDHDTTIFHSSEYTLVIDVHVIEEYDEEWIQEGTLTLKTKKGKISSWKIYGSAGC